ncbi:Uncharacterized protein BP5553_03426 [Venustampulla echinocandica]|uniref:Aminoglycoside phosphotransferase domain-containing protein n=1 Tax=Venustampulla echinocandica TaxID=2656787 RepID=A0A370TU85_9HELO|nr:Uncharacterized protein BP5553_03426 [Venustampulla echinocandica]RDL39086.1 Uncharacterized protein BP5553_03426 [Venustampulla echinocandica]
MCRRIEKELGLIGGLNEGDRVIQLSDGIVVKYGHGVTPTEAATQAFAYRHVDRSLVRVPRVYRFFQDRCDVSWPKGYLFMEYVPSRNLKDLYLSIHKEIIPRVASIIYTLVKFPVVRCQAQWAVVSSEDTDGTTCSCISDTNSWLNKRLTVRNESTDLTPYLLVLCHVDLCRRNMILDLEDDSMPIGLVDWGHAELFPLFFEITTISCLNPYEVQYQDFLLQAAEMLLHLTEDEKRLMKLMQIVRAASLRHLLSGC